jgi:malonyl-CoA O-methyltransferase
MPEWKANVINRFDSAADNYARYSDVQQEVAAILMSHLPDKVPVNILEVGCGDGFLTSLLTARFPHSAITAIDTSPAMLKKAREKLTGRGVDFQIMDGEALSLNGPYDLIISSMTAQWFGDIQAAYGHWKSLLTAGGFILSARPGPESFTEWRMALNQCGYANGLIPFQDGGPVIDERLIKYPYAGTMSFLKAMKKTGALTARVGYTPLSAGALRRACAVCDDMAGGVISWQIIVEKIEVADSALS